MVAPRWGHIDLGAGAVTFTSALAKVTGGTAEKGSKAALSQALLPILGAANS